MTRASLVVVLISIAVGLPGCDLQHLPERMRCWQADDDWKACRELIDICTPDGGPRCEGTEDSVCASACRSSENADACVLPPNDAGACGAQGLVGNAGVFNGPRHSTGWNLLPLERSVWEPRTGTAIDRVLLADMTPRQRRALCATSRTLDATGRSPCMLAWDEDRGHAACERLEDPCAECELVMTEFRCIPRNLCNGVICP